MAKKRKPTKLDAFITSVAQAATLGYADEATAAIGAIIDTASGEEGDFQSLYKKRVKQIRKLDDENRAAHPVFSMATEVVSGMISPVPGAKLKAASTLGKIASTATKQAGQIFAEQYGRTGEEAFDIEEATKNTVMSLGIGGALSRKKAFSTKRTQKKLSQAEREADRAARELSSLTPSKELSLEKRLGKEEARNILNTIKRELVRGGTSKLPQELQDRMIRKLEESKARLQETAMEAGELAVEKANKELSNLKLSIAQKAKIVKELANKKKPSLTSIRDEAYKNIKQIEAKVEAGVLSKEEGIKLADEWGKRLHIATKVKPSEAYKQLGLDKAIPSKEALNAKADLDSLLSKKSKLEAYRDEAQKLAETGDLSSRISLPKEIEPKLLKAKELVDRDTKAEELVNLGMKKIEAKGMAEPGMIKKGVRKAVGYMPPLSRTTTIIKRLSGDKTSPAEHFEDFMSKQKKLQEPGKLQQKLDKIQSSEIDKSAMFLPKAEMVREDIKQSKRDEKKRKKKEEEEL